MENIKYGALFAKLSFQCVFIFIFLEWKGLFGSCFLKLFSILKKKENKENTFGSSFSFVMRNIQRTLNSDNKNSFQRTLKWCSLCFKNVLKNNF